MVLKLFDFVDRPTLVEERAVATAAPTAARGSITGRSSPTFPRRLRATELPSTAGRSSEEHAPFCGLPTESGQTLQGKFSAGWLAGRPDYPQKL